MTSSDPLYVAGVQFVVAARSPNWKSDKLDHYPSADESLEEQLQALGHGTASTSFSPLDVRKRVEVLFVDSDLKFEKSILTSITDPTLREPSVRVERKLIKEELNNYDRDPEVRTLRSERWRRWVLRILLLVIVEVVSLKHPRRLLIEMHRWYASYDYGDLPLTAEEVEETEREGRPIFRIGDQKYDNHRQHVERWAKRKLLDSKVFKLIDEKDATKKKALREEVTRGELVEGAMPRRLEYERDLRDLIAKDAHLLDGLMDREDEVEGNAKLDPTEKADKLAYLRSRKPGHLQRTVDLYTEFELFTSRLVGEAVRREPDSYVMLPRMGPLGVEEAIGAKVQHNPFVTVERWRWYKNGTQLKGTKNQRAEIEIVEDRSAEYYVNYSAGNAANPNLFVGVGATKYVTVLQFCWRCSKYVPSMAIGERACSWTSSLGYFEDPHPIPEAPRVVGSFPAWMATDQISYQYANYPHKKRPLEVSKIPRAGVQRGSEKWEGRHSFETSKPDLPTLWDGEFQPGSLRKLFQADIEKLEVAIRMNPDDIAENFEKILRVYLQ